ncbi:glycosyltransferase family 2 protein [Methanolobus chelungpuianus]|uniref:glycosyltransferase family 2 protein n=1 Tax=Methanolobus chelungpuianus TaxID=502115 RepID=UPI0021145B55|nr:glycosyltransferase [Methanolobus chelungpuianus]
MSEPEISVVMSVYNGEKHLDECIGSILGQSFRDFELIIVNDCSMDGSLKIIERYEKSDHRIKVINNPENLGLTKSLNIGIKISRGKYIARIDADDICSPDRFEIQYQFLEKQKHIFLAGSGTDKIDESGNTVSRHRPIVEEKEIEKELSLHNCVSHPTIMFRNEGFTYREKFVYAQDYDFYLILLSGGKKISNIPEPLVKYRISPCAISWSKKAKQDLFALKANEFYQQRLKNGSDQYGSFNPGEILHIEIEESTDRLVLKSEIEASFKLNDFKRVRKLCRTYCIHYGFVNCGSCYYVLSFAGERVINKVRLILFS